LVGRGSRRPKLAGLHPRAGF